MTTIVSELSTTGPIRIVATFTAIAPQHRESFKETVVELSELVASEEGTLEYSYFLTADESRCMMFETYANDEALATHMAHVGHLLGPLFAAGGSVDVDILGDAPPSLVEATKDSHPTFYSLFSEARLPSGGG